SRVGGGLLGLGERGAGGIGRARSGPAVWATTERGDTFRPRSPATRERAIANQVSWGPHPFGRLIWVLYESVVVEGVGWRGDEAEDRALVVGDHRHAPVRAVGRGTDHLAAVAGYQVDGLVG